jgi:hypothetical protein
MIYVYRDGKYVDKATVQPRAVERSGFPTPRVSRLDPFESPVTGKEISTWRERDADMKAVDAVDLRDYPKDHVFKRGRDVQLQEDPL